MVAGRRKRASPAARTLGAVSAHRQRQKQSGRVRLELSVPQADAPLLRAAAAALNDPSRRADARDFLAQRFAAPTSDFKAFLLTLPIEDLDLDRLPLTPRDVDL